MLLPIASFAKRCLALVVASVLYASAAQAVTVDLITNGDFETGDLSGWNSTSSSYAEDFQINNGRFNPRGPTRRVDPISGSYDVMNEQTGYGISTLTQFFTVPDRVISASFNFTYQLVNHYASGFDDPNQQFRVSLIDDAGAVISQIFSTQPGDAAVQGATPLSYDLTSYLQAGVGSTLGIQFDVETSYYYMNASLDDIAMMVETPATVPLPASVWMMLAGLGLFVALGRSRKARNGVDIANCDGPVAA
ncbi:VPLPA-CTERM sorting domain-containing protein [Thioclava sp. DLFJ5-1]|uniref:VPLPA-CTERM sorting domain-containing protein n=1 Tax=Thioclava sp. DLFJ5-1 TaxID=1915314 RepID=UPI000997A065|nr:VPLPA-CTERM sorting domain-containing protein [Thioclava sp. DLFJ5-1]